MRGILSCWCTRSGSAGISPAHAGNTPPSPSSVMASGDQPRTCGEYLAIFATLDCEIGSAPHMRGIPGNRAPVGYAAGISPAHAGNTNVC